MINYCCCCGMCCWWIDALGVHYCGLVMWIELLLKVLVKLCCFKVVKYETNLIENNHWVRLSWKSFTNSLIWINEDVWMINGCWIWCLSYCGVFSHLLELWEFYEFVELLWWCCWCLYMLMCIYVVGEPFYMPLVLNCWCKHVLNDVGVDCWSRVNICIAELFAWCVVHLVNNCDWSCTCWSWLVITWLICVDVFMLNHEILWWLIIPVYILIMIYVKLTSVVYGGPPEGEKNTRRGVELC